MESEVRYELLRPSEIVAMRDKRPVAYVPLGTLEWHGPHNPVGLDGLKAHALCVRAAQNDGGVVFPVVWYGEHRESHLMEINKASAQGIHAAYGVPDDNFAPGYTRSGTIIDQAVDYVRLLWKIACQVHSLGFKALVFFNGHYPLSHYGRFLSHLIERHLQMKVWAGHEGEVYPGHGDHAGIWETSLMMADRPDRVNLEELREAGEFVGCSANALDATEEQGEAWSSEVVERLVNEVGELLPRQSE